MKKLQYIIVCILLQIQFVYATEKEQVQFLKCTDGDTMHVMYQGEDRVIRFLAIDTPEYTKTKEAYGKEASAYTCEAIQNATQLTIEFDPASKKQDKYGRLLAWVFVDGELLQEKLIQEGLAEISYVYGDYKYMDELQKAQQLAKQEKRNLWTDIDEQKQKKWMVEIISFVCVIFIILISISKTKAKKRKIRNIKKVMRAVRKT